MKQHITEEQINEIVKYADFIELIEPFVSYEAVDMGENIIAKEMTIGKMIEIIEKNCQDVIIGFPGVVMGQQYQIRLFKDEDKFIRANTLCDALWATVKYILPKD